MAIEAKERILHYLEPMLLMALSAIRESPALNYKFRSPLIIPGRGDQLLIQLVLCATVVDVIFVQRKPRVLFKPTEFRDLWFARFWLYLGVFGSLISSSCRGGEERGNNE